MSASRYVFTNSSPAALAAVPAGMVTVIDWIMAHATGTAPMIILLDGGPIGGAAATTLSFFVDFSGGFPVWNASNTEDTPRSAPSITITGGALTNVGIHVGYHYEKESVVRANNLDRRGGV